VIVHQFYLIRYYWRGFRNAGYVDLTYFAFFVILVWALIHGIDYAYRIIKRKNKNQDEQTEK